VELRDQHGIKAGNSTARRKYEYWVEGKREVEPLHGPLQRRFVEFLAGREIDCVQDESYVDIRYQQDGVEVLVEVTPTANVDTRYAIRAAVGSTSNTG